LQVVAEIEQWPDVWCGKYSGFFVRRFSFCAFCGGNWFRIDLDFEQETCAVVGTCSCPWCLGIHGTRVLDMQERGGMEIEKL
jgi:hypothetical protein